jgi:adenine-specific DNA-methyltransferase
MCDEVFGRRNFVCTLIWNKQHSQQQGLFKKYHEYVVVYAKNVQKQENITGGEGIIEAGALKKISKANPASEFTFPADVRFDAPDGTTLTGTFGDSEKVSVIRGQLIAQDGKTLEGVTLSAGWTQKDQMTRFFSGGEVYDTKGQKVINFFFNSSGKLKSLKERSKITPPTLLPKYGMVSEQSQKLSELMGASVFDTPKPVPMLSDFVAWFSGADEIVMDFFSGSGTMGEAVMSRNAHDGARRKFILAQIPEATPQESEARNAGYENIAEITKERLRRAGTEILKGECHPGWNKDVGFRVLKIDTSNMEDVYYRPDEVKQADLLTAVDNVKPDRTAEDLLFQVLVDWGVDLTLPIRREIVQGKTVFFVDDNALVACFDTGITEDLVKELAGHEPLRVVFRDNGFVSDALKINVEQIFRQLSPTTDVKSI